MLKNNKHFVLDNFRRRRKLEIGIFTNVKFECSFHYIARHLYLWQVIVNMASYFEFSFLCHCENYMLQC